MGYGDSHEGGHHWWIEIVERGIDVPAVEAGVREIIFFGDEVLVKCLMVRVLELDVVQSFVLWHEAVADYLDLWLMRNSFEIGVEDAPFGV